MFTIESLLQDEFSWRAALSLATACRLAYHTETEISRTVAESWQCEQSHVFSTQDTDGFIAAHPQAIVVSFRGTTSVADWLRNLNVFGVTRSYGEVHGGFFNGFDAVQAEIRQALADLNADDKRIWLTGHSLGGALAAVAAAELADAFAIAGIYTFGMPRVGNAAFQNFFAARYGGEFFRFVNNDDIVPRLPWNYGHVGQLLYFDEHGQLVEETPAGVEAIGRTEPEPLTQEEFETLQRELEELHRQAESAGAMGLEGEALFEQSVEGLIPGVSDHNISRYISLIQRQLDGAEVDPAVTNEVLSSPASLEFGLEAIPAESAPVPILLRVKDPAWQPPGDLTIQSRMGNIVTAIASQEQIDALQADSAVVSIEASRSAGYWDCDASIPFVHADAVHVPPLDERGDAAIVGIIDSGADVLHEAFLDDAGQTRILAVWYQRPVFSATGGTPKAVNDALYTQDYGVLHVQSELQSMIDGQIAAPAYLRDPGLHGTHVASIAAGREAGDFAGGVAPEAKIVVVVPNMVSEPGDPPSIGYSNSHVDALAFIQATAREVGLPAAVNVSLGMNAGAHDGSSTLEAAFDEFSGIGRDPGFAVIKSAGNERGHAGHAKAAAFPNGISSIVWRSSDTFRLADYIEAWYSPFDDIEFTLIDPSGNRSAPISSSNPDVTVNLGGNRCRLTMTEFHRDNGDNRLQLTIQPQEQSIHAGDWTLEMQGISIQGGGEVHAWVERDRSRAVEFITGDNSEMTLSIPGTAKTVITVGACASGLPLRLTNSSSFGPTRDRRPKPEISAPGSQINAAHANQTDATAITAMTGTSMAAPHVTGAIALLFSRLHKNPTAEQVNAMQIRMALIRSSQPSFSGLHNIGHGYGALDVQALLDQF